ncbi:UDP-3-O-(3-hydroxymyristoyl)glucosamine N-acyltransferase [Methyloversatilis thermotolerans]|uniref:UDP-3-O-(3-hydroxymyristoyl)glucosamine N-acyltransferase n=1 Tax=Methyloversatilis thermotolerans TaxID=1346290 RepID=UPI0003659EB3|nr:UDP-3-O-(3-hydroxymyristoyl)glucosamine N-acyltransferase [Methyloversatilis thermotolerans]
MAARLGDIVARLGGELHGDADLLIEQVAPLDSAGSAHISFLSSPKYRSVLAASGAGAVIVTERDGQGLARTHVRCKNPYLYFARVAQLLNPVARPAAGVHPSATVHAGAQVHPDAAVAAGAVIGEGAVVGARSVIGAGSVLGDGVHLGEDCLLHAHVVIYAGCRVGDRCILHSGAVIGADGFGFAREADGSWVKIPQIGRVLIGNDVEIGANATVDRGALEDTVIGDGVKLDNLIQIAHNVRIGDHTAMAGCSGVAGSTTIGKRCMIGGSARIMGHIDIVDDVVVSAVSFATKSITAPGVYTGSVPSMEHKDWTRNYSRLRHLDAMAERIRALEKQLASMQENKDE